MEWSQLFLRKDEWQKNTFDRIKRDLISSKDNPFVRYDNSEENHLVMIYGKSQVGKTTMILSMIGIKEEFFQEVYDTLRAGVPRGNSSTSTAIIYSKSNNNKYSCSVSSINDLSAKGEQYFNKEEMIEYLTKIRNNVESNRASTDAILFIYIPDDYFINDPNINNISIMDMPGVESRNHKEDIHVRNLMTKYIPISSVCIIACRSNDIQSLETTVLPNNLDWQRMEHRFILVITHSYSNGTTKRYFKTKLSERKQDFCGYVRSTYTQEIRKILGKENKTEVYPIDVGETFNKLSQEIQNETDRYELIKTKNTILSDLRNSIVNHKGERLKSALNDLNTLINNYEEYEIVQKNEQISMNEENIKNRKKLIAEAEKTVEEFDGEYSEKNELISVVSTLENFRSQFGYMINSSIQDLDAQIEQNIISKQLYKESNNIKYLADKEEKVFGIIRDYVSEKTELFINKLMELIRQAAIGQNMPVNKSNILMKADDFVSQNKDKLYPPKKGFFSKREKICFYDVRVICSSIQSNVNMYLNSYVRKAVDSIDLLVSQKEDEIKIIDSIIKDQYNKIQKYNDEISKYNLEINNLKEQLETIEKKKQQDKETLKSYLDYAHEAYLEERNSIVKQINTSAVPYEKLLLIFLLGLLDEDYQKVTGGINENRY